MSPDRQAERVVSAAIARAIRRARLVGLAEAAVWGLAAASISGVAGALMAAAVAAVRWRAWSRASVVRRLEHAQPHARNLFVTADEIARGTLAPKPMVRARVFADAAERARSIDWRLAFPLAPLASAALLAAAGWTIVGTLQLWRGPSTGAGSSGVSLQGSADAKGRGRLHVNVVIQPPSYTGLKESTLVDPEQLQAIEGSALVLSIDTPAPAVSVEHDGRTSALTRAADGRFVTRLPVTRTGFVLVAANEGVRRMMPLVVSPDALPAVRLTAPGRDLVYAGGNPRITFAARATDDFGLRSLMLRYTKVTGSGETFEFQEGEIPLTVKPASVRDWTGSASRSLTDLNLKDGDMLVYRAVAADARPGDGSATSDAFFIEISKLGVAAGDAFTLPEEDSKYALSQQMLIVKTERLQQRRAALPAGEFAEQALNLAVEQRMVRAELVFMLGGEIDDEEVEAERSVELQAGRLQNRGQRDLRAATLAMSEAQKLLTGADAAAALVAERAAVTALQRAFARDRYILRAMATRSRLDPARRMTGSLADATGWRRVAPDVPVNRRIALLADVLRGIAELVSVRPLDAARDLANALVLAEEAIRIDPGAASLRTVATDLQRAAAAPDAVTRSAALTAAATAAAFEARRAQADAPLRSQAVSPALSGAFADALRRAR